MRTAAEARDRLMPDARLLDRTVVLGVGDHRVGIRSNSAPLLDRLTAYFAHCLSDDQAIEVVIAIDGPPPELDVPFTDWAREPGKTGRKEAIFDLEDGRLVLKVRTGMVFLQSRGALVAAGPCLTNDNQVINFVNSQFMNRLQHEGGLICHAAALVVGGQALAVAGFSGGGKSTLMLHMLEDGAARYLTNDRLFLMRPGDGEPPLAVGIPKLPRVNPGTLMGSDRLRPILSETEQASLAALPKSELWELEQKYDIDVAAVYGRDRLQAQAPLGGVLLLNWQRDSEAPCRIRPVDPAERPDLLPALMKSPGPFYQFPESDSDRARFYQDDMTENAEDYIARLSGVRVWEASGGIDFGTAAEFALQAMRTEVPA